MSTDNQEGIEDVIVKMSCCNRCKGIVRVAVKHEITTKSKNQFLKEVMEYNLSVTEVYLTEYRASQPEWCKCNNNQNK